ncbi:helix-turn-helix domain-containing protein [Neorhizobium sp. T25_27]|uniref:helix-turn-helix domain-containing protein n=1 Tax=Neorhizobium sp. T25_27 TaxID=2093831 RepID=UPI000CF879DF|nr:helix-turn-helix domain-containing protein [Neorhizobium sp. T25_27]
MPFERYFQSSAPPSSLPFSPPVPLDTAGSPMLPASLPLKSACRIVRQMVSELVQLFGDRVMLRRDRRRLSCHVRQIAMYVCHVALQISMSDIGEAFGRDRTTVGHACHVVEDRRDDLAFDEFVSAVERIVTAVFGLSEVAAHD